MKRCNKCRKVKSLSEFHKCKKHKDGLKFLNEAPKIKLRIYLNSLKHKYAITYDDLVSMLDNQRGCCDSCGHSLIFPDSLQNYHVDHSHLTGEVRSLLCYKCNIAFGLLEEDSRRIEGLLKYSLRYDS